MSEHTSRSQAGARLPTIPGLPPCTIEMAVDGTWHVTTQLADGEQDALVTAAPSPEALCQRAQHALGLAGIGSRIAPERDAIGVYVPTSPAPFSTTPLVLEGRPLLWTVSHASSEAVRALIAAAMEVMRAPPTPLTH